MPCKTYSPESEAEEKIEILKERIDELTNLLCEATTIIADQLCENTMSRDLNKWFHDHQTKDRERLAEEILKDSSITSTQLRNIRRILDMEELD